MDECQVQTIKEWLDLKQIAEAADDSCKNPDAIDSGNSRMTSVSNSDTNS